MNQRPFTLYWSSLEMWEQCPQKFLWSKGWGAIEVGGGPGRSKPKPVKKSDHHALMGIVIGNVIEKLYNNELWRDPPTLSARLLAILDEEFQYRIAKTYIDWQNSPPKTELYAVCREGVEGFIKTLKANRLLGPYARSEVELLAFANKYTPIGGRADIIIRRDDTGLSILDGKNAQTKGKYTNPDQLRWYAMCFFLAHKEFPARLGFVYYRYPYGKTVLDDQGVPVLDEQGKEKIEQGVDWVSYEKDDLKTLVGRAIEARKGMDKERFDATPTPQNCKFCDYETVCPPRLEQKALNRRNSPKLQIEDAGQVFGFEIETARAGSNTPENE